MGNLFSYHTAYQVVIIILLAEVLLPGSISIAKDLLSVISGIVHSFLNRTREGLTAAGVPIPANIFGQVAGSTPESPDPIIQDASSQDRICGYVIIRRQFTPGKFNLFGAGPGTGPHSAGGRQPGLKDDSDSTRAGTLKGQRRDLAGSVSRGFDISRTDSLDDASSAISTVTTNSSMSTKATSGSTTSLPAAANKPAGLWAAARNAMPVLSRPVVVKERYYCVIKGATIYLYDDQRQTDPLHVIAVDQYKIKVHTSQGEFKGRDGEMFNKKHAIVLQHYTQEDNDDGLAGVPMSRKNTPTSRKDLMEDQEPWYLFVRNHSDMEDWYLGLLRQSHDEITHEKTFSPLDMQYLVNTITNEVDPIASRWINSLLGVLFLRICETAFAEKFIIGRIMRKLRKIPKSTFFRDIAVREVNLGTVPPSIHKPMLKDIQASGHTAIDFHFRYDARSRTSSPDSAFRITFAAIFSLGSLGFDIPFVAAASVKYIEGDMTVKVKPAPSNRIWYGFTSEPQMDFDISIMHAGQTDFKVESKILMNKLKEFIKKAIAEAIVVPNMDDLAFFDSTPDETRGVPDGSPRGGIFDSASKMDASKTNREEVTIKPGQAPSQQPGITINTDNIQSEPSLGKHIKDKLSPTKRDPSPPKAKPQGISSITPPKKRSPIRMSIPLPNMGSSKRRDKTDDLTLHKNFTEPVLTTEPLLITDPDDVDTPGRLENQRAAPPQQRRISPDSGIADRAPAPARPQTIHGDGSVIAGSSLPRASASPTRRTGGILSSWTRPISSASIESKDQDSSILSRSSSPSDTIHTPTDQAQVVDNTVRSPVPAPAGSSDPSAAAPAASVMDLFKARDRPGLEARGAVAKTRFAKWGTESLARGKAEYQRLKGEAIKPAAQPSSIPVPTQGTSTGIATTTTTTTGTSPTAHLGRSPGKSLQERLREAARAAEAANAATLGHHADGRLRSGSNTSSLSASSVPRPALLSSPSKGEPSTSEPDLVSATHHNAGVGVGGNTSTTPPVASQPAAGRGMVVPRMATRSGESTSLPGGKSPAKHDVSKKEDTITQIPAESPDTKTINIGPPLPPRHEPLPDTTADPMISGAGSSVGSPPKMGGPPPPLPRKDRPVADIATKSNSLIGLTELGHEREMEMERSRSQPGQPRSPPVKSKTLPTPSGDRSMLFSLRKGKKDGKDSEDTEGSFSELPPLERSLSFEDMLNDPRGPDVTEAITMSRKQKKTSPSRAQHALRMFSDRTSPKKGDIKLEPEGAK